MCTEQKIEELLRLFLKDENIVNCDVKIHGKTGKTDGYVAELNFVTVTITTQNGNKKILELAVKASKNSGALRSQVPLKEASLNEIFTYSKVIPTFREFQNEKNLDCNLLDMVPFCYGTDIIPTSEILILESLKPGGYVVNNRKTPMTFEHVKMTLEAYGRFHAFSFALKDQHFEKFQSLKREHPCVNLLFKWMAQGNMFDFVKERLDAAISTIKDEPDKNKILEKVDFSLEEVIDCMRICNIEEPEYHVFVHGDCWNNNYMYRLENGNPVAVKIIDWQMLDVASPVADLSSYIFSCCSKEDYHDMDKLLRIYHSSFSETLVKLGSDPEKLYPFEKLKSHWQKFSKYGFLISNFYLKFCCCEDEEVPDYAETADKGGKFCDNLYFKVRDEKPYQERARSNLLHYVKHCK